MSEIKTEFDHIKTLSTLLKILGQKNYWRDRCLAAEKYWRARCMALEEFIEQMPDSWTDLTPGQQKAVIEYEKFLSENKEPA